MYMLINDLQRSVVDRSANKGLNSEFALKRDPTHLSKPRIRSIQPERHLQQHFRRATKFAPTMPCFQLVTVVSSREIPSVLYSKLATGPNVSRSRASHDSDDVPATKHCNPRRRSRRSNLRRAPVSRRISSHHLRRASRLGKTLRRRTHAKSSRRISIFTFFAGSEKTNQQCGINFFRRQARTSASRLANHYLRS
jgi:hypothetical protein